jgi:hypothetical protein
VAYGKGWENNEWIFTDDGYVITNDTFTYYDAATGDIGFAGTIADYIAEDDANGRLFIKITNGGTWGKTSGYYYAIICRNISASDILMGGAYDGASSKNDGVPTLEEAKTEYAYSVAGSGYFGYPASYYTKRVAPRDLGAVEGKWYYSDSDMYVVIRGNTFLSFVDGDDTAFDGVYAPDDDAFDFLGIAGEVVDHINNDASSGILYIHTVVPGSGYQSDKYEAVAWKKDGNNISFYTQMDNHSSLAEVKAAYTDANDTSQFPAAGFYQYVNP